MAESQISAFISDATRLKLERSAEAHGLKKGYLVEEALLHHLQALHDLPTDIVVPARLKITAKSLRDHRQARSQATQTDQSLARSDGRQAYVGRGEHG